MRALMIVGFALATAAAGPGGRSVTTPVTAWGLRGRSGVDTVVVKMVDKGPSSFAFEPAHVTVHQGDVLRFVQTVSTPHDVAFTKLPAKVDLGARKVGPFLTQPGQTYDLTIDDAFRPGHYDFVCLPHMAMGMKGTLDVEAGASTHTSS